MFSIVVVLCFCLFVYYARFNLAFLLLYLMNVCTLWWIFCVFISSSFIEDLKAVLHVAACCEGFPLSLKASCSYHQCLSCMFEPFHGFFGHNLPYSWFASLLFWEFDLLMQPKYGLLDTETASKCKCFSLGKGKNSLSCWKNKTNKQWMHTFQWNSFWLSLQLHISSWKYASVYKNG